MPQRAKADRPLSPHLQIYRPQLTTALSILHRISGVALSVGLLMLTWFLLALAGGPETYVAFASFAGSLLGKIMILGWTAALCYHACSGVRHLFFEQPSILERTDDIVATVHDCRGDVFKFVCVFKQLFVAIQEALVHKVMALDACERISKGSVTMFCDDARIRN